MDTREQILHAALRLFACDGYEAVSVSRIAGMLGMTKGALYKHYASKRAIFDAILARMAERDAERAGEFGLPERARCEDETAYRAASGAQLLQYSIAQLRYWTQDEFAACFRRLLTLEQYRSAELSALYQQYLAAGPLGYVADLFDALGVPDAARAAAAFYAPMFLFYSICDGTDDPAAALRQADACLRAALPPELNGKEGSYNELPPQ